MRNKKLGILLLVLLMSGVCISILSLYLGDSKRGDVDISFVEDSSSLVERDYTSDLYTDDMPTMEELGEDIVVEDTEVVNNNTGLSAEGVETSNSHVSSINERNIYDLVTLLISLDKYETIDLFADICTPDFFGSIMDDSFFAGAEGYGEDLYNMDNLSYTIDFGESAISITDSLVTGEYRFTLSEDKIANVEFLGWR